LRAFFAIAAACAIVIGLFAPVAAQASADRRHQAVFKNGGAGLYCLVHRHLAGGGDASHSPVRPSSGGAGCPDCCLAAQGGVATMPARPGVIERSTQRASARILYTASSASEPRSAATGAANGARAPPVRG
jgi:hypothetical protein